MRIIWVLTLPLIPMNGSLVFTESFESPDHVTWGHALYSTSDGHHVLHAFEPQQKEERESNLDMFLFTFNIPNYSIIFLFITEKRG